MPEGSFSCQINEECCSKHCQLIPGASRYGVCLSQSANKPRQNYDVASKASGCLQNWDVTCRNDMDCCSKCCRKSQPWWMFGTCMPTLNSNNNNNNNNNMNMLKQYCSSENCKPNWDVTCRTDAECCSRFCDTKDGKNSFGVCKPIIVTQTNNPYSTSSVKMIINCKVNGDSTCLNHLECCSRICEKNNEALRQGVCREYKPSPPPDYTY